MQLGAFSVSIGVKDLVASRDFYGQLGFEPVGGDGENWQILKNGTTLIGLFQGMFEGISLTFNPGWDSDQGELPEFMDVREIRAHLVAAGVDLSSDTTGKTEAGPASFVIKDPDGHPVLIDQHR